MMTGIDDDGTDRDELIEQLFHRALQRPEHERRDWIVSACTGDDELAHELIELVCAHDEAPSCFDEPAWSPGHMLAADGEELSLGSAIGPYVLGRLLGEGGMGSVFLAEQCEPLRRQVALKVIKPGMDTREVLARFNGERQLLARLSHPHVAAVHDAGVTPRGRPYFVMEFVDGEPITAYCDRRRLGVAERLELFELVCHAMQHAHQKGVMHRDLKPGNILVSEQDGRVVPKIIDFGVAKAVAGDPSAHHETACTRVGQQIGTPGYMSPEQALPGRGVVDTRTDVYSLGVLLHELLVGALPRDARRLNELGPEGLARELAETDLEAPSRRLTALGAAGKRYAARRDTDLRGLVRSLRGDLDWIVLKAVATDPDQRYASASELAADVTNSLAGLPVLAGPPGFFYRARRLAGAHRVPVASAVVLLGALFAWPTMVAYLRGQELKQYSDADNSLVSSAPEQSTEQSCALCEDELAAVHDTVLITNAGGAELALGDLVELVGETRRGDDLVMQVAPASAGSGRAPLGPVSTALALLQDAPGHRHAVSGAIAPGGLGRVVVRGTLAWLSVDDSGGSIRANEPLVVSTGAARAAASSEQNGVIVGTALQSWSGPGQGLIRAFIAPRWSESSPRASGPSGHDATDDRADDQHMGGGGLAFDGSSSPLDDGDDLTTGPTVGMVPRAPLLPATMTTTGGSPGVVGVAGASGLAPGVSTLQQSELLTDVLRGGTVSGPGGGGSGSNAGHSGDPSAGFQGQGSSQKSAPLQGGDDEPDAPPTDEQAWGDLNGDGLADLVITAQGETTVIINRGQGLFENRTRWSGLPDGFVGRRPTLTDVDGDETLDLLSLDDDGRLQLHQGLGDGRLVESSVAAGLDDLPPLLDFDVVDPEDDGAPDLQLLTREGALLFLLNDGRATFTMSVLRAAPVPVEVLPSPFDLMGAGDGGAAAGDEADNMADEPVTAGGGQGGSQMSTPGGGR